MNLLANYRQRIEKNKVILIRRQLHGKGEITCQVGQEVSPQDILGRSKVAAGFRSTNLAKLLGISPKEAKKYLSRQIGQKIFRGELLAFKKAGFLSEQKIVTSPTDGTIESYSDSTGELRISFLSHTIDLPAAVFGVVEKVDTIRGQVIIKTQATEINGLVGSGNIREGTIKIIGARSDPLTKLKLSHDAAGHILVTGALVNSNIISSAVAEGVHGIISGGISASDFKAVGGRLYGENKLSTDVGIGILVCEGFGSVPIGEDIFTALLEFNNKFAIIDGNRARLLLPSCEKDCMLNVRKTAIPIENTLIEALNVPKAVNLSIGQKVRIISISNLGEQGEIIAIDSAATLLPSGIKTYMVTVQTKTRKLKMPYSNIEVI